MGLSGDAIISWNGKKMRLFYIKTAKPSKILGYEKYDNLILDGADINIDALEMIYSKINISVVKKIFSRF